MVGCIIEDFLGQPLGSTVHIYPAEDLEEGPDYVVPKLIAILVPKPLLKVDRYKPRPEDDEEDRSPLGILILRVRRKNRS